MTGSVKRVHFRRRGRGSERPLSRVRRKPTRGRQVRRSTGPCYTEGVLVVRPNRYLANVSPRSSVARPNRVFAPVHDVVLEVSFLTFLFLFDLFIP